MIMKGAVPSIVISIVVVSRVGVGLIVCIEVYRER